MSTATDPTSAEPYTPDDLLWLREHLGGHVELDPWGNAVVSPASDPHFNEIVRLHESLVLALAGADAVVGSEGPPWRVPSGSGYTNVPDLTVLPGSGVGRATAEGAELAERSGPRPDHEWHLSPPPLLVVEVASPSTRVIDRTRKAQDYLLGGAGAYLLVDLPGLASVNEPTLELRVPRDGEWGTTATGPAVELQLAGRAVALRA